MSKKTASLALAVLLLALLLIPTAAAQTEPGQVRVNVLFGDLYEATTNDILVLNSGWLACTPGLVRAFIAGSNYEVVQVGSPEPLLTPGDVDHLWGAIQPGYHDLCKNPDVAALARWEYEWGPLPPGEYQIHTTMWTDHPLQDGIDHDGDGHPDVQFWRSEHTVTIIVTSAD